MKAGDRVIAISHFDQKQQALLVFGEGVYLGMFPLPPEVPGFNFGQENPKIQLDNGKVVWGCMCWYGSVQNMKERFSGFKWETIEVPDFKQPCDSDQSEEEGAKAG